MTPPVMVLHPEREYDPRRSTRQAAVLIVAMTLLHTLAVWGYTGTFWGDYGRWLHEVERFANGEVPYRDFQWHFPPLAIWLVGTAARVSGTSPFAVSVVTAGICLGVFLAFLRFLLRAAPAVVVPASATGILFATAYANRAGAPLPLGTWSPAGPLGMLFMLTAAMLALRLSEHPSRRDAVLVGLMAGLAALCKHDFWVPSLYLVVVSAFLARPEPAEEAFRVRSRLLIAFAATGLVGAGWVAMAGGAGALSGLIGGFGSAGEVLARGVPYGERITIEIAATAAMGLVGVVSLWLSFSISDSRAGQLVGVFLLILLSACAVHVGMSIGLVRDLNVNGPSILPTPLQETLWPQVLVGRSAAATALATFDQRFLVHLFPMLLPPLLIVVLLLLWNRWPDPTLRGRALLLLGLCVAMRLPNGFAAAVWYNPLMEIPAYALFLRLVAGITARRSERTVSAAIGMLFIVGIYAYFNLGRGPLTRQVFPATTVERGVVHWPEADVVDYRDVRRILDERDPSRTRPLYAFGQSGAWIYWMERPAPWRVTRGFVFSDVNGPEFARFIRGHVPAPLLVDNRGLLRHTIAPQPRPFSWEPAMQLTLHSREDRALFDIMTQGCTAIPVEPGDTPRLTVFDCAVTPPDSSR